ncbi:MAG: DUF6311 domain-containing protein [Propionibacteriaceae bacterium]|nr:DUF6311 domain-containing protein [Propionibacteriaceae bacterium]
MESKGRLGLISRLLAGLHDSRTLFLVCGLFGVVAFLLIYGTAVLDFRYTAWLMQGYDPTQHFTGWLFFRNSAWHFPIGLMDNIVYPNKVSVIYTDSIPLFAVLFKLFAPILPASFQYFGLFGLLCYFLQGAIAGVILFRIGRSIPFALVGSWFFILSTTLMQRVFFHNALAAHFIILLCIYVCITKDDHPRTLRADIGKWCGLFCLAASIHPYFFPMVFVFALGYFVDDCLAYRRFRGPILTLGLSTISGFLVLYVFGAFFGSGSRAAGGLGEYSANLLAFVNPATTVNQLNWSRFLQGMSTTSICQDEGFAYLGLGMLLAVFLAVVSLFRNLPAIRTAARSTVQRRRAILAIVLFLVFFLIALSPEITVASHTVVTYPIPKVIREAWSVFRSSGRFIWAPAYIVMLAALWVIRKDYKRLSTAIMAFLLIVQVVDLGPAFGRSGEFANRVGWQTQLPSPAWDEIGTSFSHIDFLWSSDRVPYLQYLEYSFGDFATRNNMTVSDYPISRDDTAEVTLLRQQALQDILNGDIDPNTVYVLDSSQVFAVSRQPRVTMYMVDDNIIALPASFTFAKARVQAIDPFELTADITALQNTSQVGGEDVNGVRVIHAGGTTWSHSMPLPSGSYVFTWTGAGMSDATCGVVYGPDRTPLPSKTVVTSDIIVQLDASLGSDLQDVATMCVNDSPTDMVVNLIALQETA